MLETIVHYMGGVLMVLGGFAMITGSMGMLRMPDFFTRIHPAGVTDSLGMPLIMVGVMLQHGITAFSGKILVLLIFLLLTNPVAVHLVAKAASISGLQPFSKKKKE